MRRRDTRGSPRARVGAPPTQRLKADVAGWGAERHKEIVRAFAKAITAGNWQRLDELVDPNFIRHSYAAPPINRREDLKAYPRSEFEIFPDGFEAIEDMLAEQDRIAVRHGFRGTQHGQMGPYPPSGNVLTGDYMAIYRIADGVIAKSWAEWDNLSGLRQLGHDKPII